ncbi:MAG TPA: electron transport complex subunit RsxC [Gammaproteobacteria bacterium]|nr:electron transport complex subunit RsxC [Gammaproteobacteria bacterium]
MLWKFHGGLHLPGHKTLSNQTPIQAAPLPDFLVFPLRQHIGETAVPVVKVGDKVLKGQVIAKAKGYVSVPVHASSSGTVVAIEARPVPHPSGMFADCIVMQTDGADQWIDLNPVIDYPTLSQSALRNKLREAGIVGLGGAGFPTFIKVNPGSQLPIETLVINGAECEPYITCDDLLMRERSKGIISGIEILQHLVQAKEVLIAIEDNKPEAIRMMQQAASNNTLIRVVPIPTVYPTGGEKQLIRVLTGKEIPSKKLPADIGVICVNPGTAYAIHRAIHHGEPLISRIVTLTGRALTNPGNLETLIGTPVKDLITSAGGETEQIDRLLMGGPMMGIALNTDNIPVIKTTNCLLAAAPDELSTPSTAQPCIRCGDCARACPADLLPQQLYWFARSEEMQQAESYHLFDCIECGCCEAVCPSQIPLVQYYRFAKSDILEAERERLQADKARLRHEAREARVIRLENEHQAKLAEKKARLAKARTSDDSKKDEIAAAIARVKAKKSNQETEP